MTERIIVAIPCFNEAPTIKKVVEDFRAVLPDAAIHVFDNNSTDGSGDLASEAGAVVHRIRQQGKGHVMRAIFNLPDADVLLVVDGDDTYFPEDIPMLLDALRTEDADMVVGNRLEAASNESMVRLHQFGNAMIVRIINRMFGTFYGDILSGYRVFGPRFLESVPVLTAGFEIETEITLQCLEEGLHIVEVPIRYRSRPAGSESKLRSFQDGWRILVTAAMLLRDHQPLRLFGLFSLLCGLIVIAAGLLRFSNYLELTEFSNSLLTGVILLFAPIGAIAFGVGLTLSAVNTRFKEMKQIMHRNKKRDD
ncbi:MAG: glycosyltransferase [Anaerolineae bacterium]|nr:glycosyltransferase [Anaerolineae bacterium]